MKSYTIIKLSNAWTSDNLRQEAESLVNEKSKEGYEIISVAFGINHWWIPTVFITLCK